MERIDKTHAHGFPGIWIPIEILMHPSLTPLEKMLFGIIKNLSSTAKGCWASNRYLGAMFSVTPQTASKSISNLIEFHFIIAEYTTLKSPINGVKQLRTLRINPEYEYLYQGMTAKVLESLSTDVRSLKENLKGYENPLDPLKENLNTPLRKILNKDTNKEFNEKEKIYKKEPSPKKSKSDLYIPFPDSFKFFPEAFQANKDFKKAWKRWFHYRISIIKSPLTPRMAKKHAKEIVEFFSIEDAIERLDRCIDSGKWIGIVFPNEKKNGIDGSKKAPATKKPKKPLSEMSNVEQADAREAAKEIKLITDYLDYFHVDYDPDSIDAELQRGREYLNTLYKKAEDASRKQKLGPYDIDYARIWQEHLPAMRDVIKAYIDDLVKWVNEPNAGFFKWDHKSFVQFRQKMQRQYYSYDWEKGRPIQS